ncbi:S1C family serine protease [Niveibacterium terrae]|uniref:S1C family serine protease n=1 Tax=Niveibacterium terrae TaxID=3373598 RepID=UPI003A8C8C10
MRRMWLLFCQVVTVALALVFVITTLKPGWLTRPANTPQWVPIIESVPEKPGASTAPGSYSAAANRALPAVVPITTSKEVSSPFANDPLFRHFFGEGAASSRSTGLGSGVIVSANGFILTNNHVIEQADDIEVALPDGRTLPASIVGRDPESDLAVLRIKAEHLQPITFGRTDNMKVGDVVLAIGNPFGVGQTVTMGIVSALGRSHLGINTFENFIQTDAAINPGNSGGALVDASGNLIGINSAIYSRSGGSLGIGFAIPVSLARSVMEQIIQTGSVTRGWIGIEVRELNREQVKELSLPNVAGVLVTGVVNGSPADAGGIAPGDILQAIGKEPITDAQRMLETIATLKPGTRTQVLVRRGDKTLRPQIMIGRRPLPERE